MSRAIIGLTLGCVGLAGCSTTSSNLAQPTLGVARAGEPARPGLILHWKDVFLPVDGQRTFTILDGTDAGQQVLMTTTSNDEKAWTIALEDRVTFAWELDDVGIVSPTTIDMPSGTTSSFSPPLPVIPKTLLPGKTMDADGTIKVVKTDTPSHQVASGTWKVSITHDADVSLKIGQDVLHCTRLHTVYSADLGLATVSRDTFDYYAQKQGLVATVFNQKIIKVIIPEKTSGTWMLK